MSMYNDIGWETGVTNAYVWQMNLQMHQLLVVMQKGSPYVQYIFQT